jgi:hypothetical protein
MTVYNFDSDNEEVYISTRHICQQGTNKWVWSDDIYCPIKAFKEHNSQLIIDRHTSYFSDFYRDRPEYKAKCLAFVESDIAKKLFKDVDKKENKPKENKSIDKKEAK